MIEIVTEYQGGRRDFSRAILSDAKLSYVDLSHADLRYADLSRADLRCADLRYADLRYADLRYADLRRASLTRADLTGADLTGADLTGADLTGADLTGADLTGADLRRANLTGANPRRANLRDADLTGAYLRDADLRDANLTGANLTDKERLRIQPLRAMLAVDGPIFAYKLLTAAKQGPYFPTAPHELGAVFEEPDANTDEHEHCGVGLHVATFDWILREPISDNIIAVVMHTAADIAAIPLTGGGKYRVRRYKVVSYLDRSKLSV